MKALKLTAFAATLMCWSSGVFAAPTIPDSHNVTSITEAAKLCELTEIGITWAEQDARTLAIQLTVEDMKQPSPKMDRLKECIFTWAYDRNVTLNVSLKQ